MKKIIFVLLLFAVSYSFGQVRVALQHQGTTTLFSGAQPLQDAYTAAVDGDTIYLPGATFGALTIAKRLVIYGTGHYPDSTTVTGISVINGINYNAGSDNSRIEGVKINGEINNFNYEIKVDSITITKCYITGSIQLYSNNFDNTHPKCENWKIYRNVIMNSISCTDASNIKIFNNIIGSQILSIYEYGLIDNNIFLTNATFFLSNVNYSLIQNNIFLNQYIVLSGQFCEFDNNLYTLAPSLGSNNTDLNSYYPITQSTIFVNQSGNTFDYTQNYHLQSPGTYLGADGSQIGIYGGHYYPYKEGAVPFNPHIISKTIPQNTDVNGHLNINIKVDAQNN